MLTHMLDSIHGTGVWDVSMDSQVKFRKLIGMNKKYPILFFLHLSSLSFLPQVFFSSSPLSLDTLVLNLIQLCQ